MQLFAAFILAAFFAWYLSYIRNRAAMVDRVRGILADYVPSAENSRCSYRELEQLGERL